MKGMVVGDDKRLNWEDVPTPQLGSNDIAINVHGTAVNRADLMQRLGIYPPPPGASPLLGLECSGIISEVGEQVTRWQPGDQVCALLAGGGYAETVVCDAAHALPVPEPLDLETAAGIPEVFATAWFNLFMIAGLQPGQKALIHAGASGVGTAAIQLCKAMGNPCFVTVGETEKLEFCRSLGADAGHLRTEGDFEAAVKDWAGKEGVTAILDPVGGSYFEQNLRCLGTDGTLVTIGLMGGRDGQVDLGRILIKRLRLIGSTLRSRSGTDKAEIVRQLEQHVWPLFKSEKLKPIIHSRFPITEANEAFELVNSNKTLGKVLLTIN